MSKNAIEQAGDEKLTAMLKAARPDAELPPGFERAVWQRIEKPERGPAGILDWLAGWVLMPRVATTGVAVVILLAAGAGVARGMRVGEREARDRYVAAVDPSYLPR